MTQTEMESMVANWILRLGLGHWAVAVDWGTPAPDDAEAGTLFDDDYDEATITFSPAYADWEARKAALVITHELVHLLLRDLQKLVEATHAPLPGAARVIASLAFLHELEGVADRFASALVAAYLL